MMQQFLDDHMNIPAYLAPGYGEISGRKDTTSIGSGRSSSPSPPIQDSPGGDRTIGNPPPPIQDSPGGGVTEEMRATTEPVDRSSKKNDTPKSTPQEFKIAGFNGYLVLVVGVLILMFSWD